MALQGAPPAPPAAAPPSAEAALGFGLAWLLVRQGVEAGAAEQRAQQLRDLLQPLHVAGVQARAEAVRYEVSGGGAFRTWADACSAAV